MLFDAIDTCTFMQQQQYNGWQEGVHTTVQATQRQKDTAHAEQRRKHSCGGNNHAFWL